MSSSVRFSPWAASVSPAGTERNRFAPTSVEHVELDLRGETPSLVRARAAQVRGLGHVLAENMANKRRHVRLRAEGVEEC